MIATAFAFLKAIDPRIWIGIAITVAVAASYGYVYRLGGNGPRAELAATVAKIKAAQEQYKIDDARKDRESTKLIKSLEVIRDETAASSTAGWAAYYRVQSDQNRPGPTEKPIPVIARVCNDADQNQRLSDAIQSYRVETGSALNELRQGIFEYRREVGELFAIADAQTADLVACKAWAVGEKIVNAP